MEARVQTRNCRPLHESRRRGLVWPDVGRPGAAGAGCRHPRGRGSRRGFLLRRLSPGCPRGYRYRRTRIKQMQSIEVRLNVLLLRMIALVGCFDPWWIVSEQGRSQMKPTSTCLKCTSPSFPSVLWARDWTCSWTCTTRASEAPAWTWCSSPTPWSTWSRYGEAPCAWKSCKKKKKKNRNEKGKMETCCPGHILVCQQATVWLYDLNWNLSRSLSLSHTLTPSFSLSFRCLG